MIENGKGILADRNASDEEVAEVMEQAIADALRAHKRAGVPIAVWDWEHNHVVVVPPDQIEVPDHGPSDRNGAPEQNGTEG